MNDDKGTLACISLALAGAIALPILIARSINVLADVILLLLLLPLIFGNKDSQKVLTLILAFASILFFMTRDYYISATLAIVFMITSCTMTKNYKCIYSLLFLPLVASLNTLERIILISVIMVTVSFVSMKITKRLHAFLLLLSIPLFIFIDFRYWGMLMSSIAAGLLFIIFSWPEKRCLFSKEPSLASTGTLISLSSILILASLGHTSYASILTAFWEMGFLLQISGLMVPKALNSKMILIDNELKEK